MTTTSSHLPNLRPTSRSMPIWSNPCRWWSPIDAAGPATMRARTVWKPCWAARVMSSPEESTADARAPLVATARRPSSRRWSCRPVGHGTVTATRIRRPHRPPRPRSRRGRPSGPRANGAARWRSGAPGRRSPSRSTPRGCRSGGWPRRRRGGPVGSPRRECGGAARIIEHPRRCSMTRNGATSLLVGPPQTAMWLDRRRRCGLARSPAGRSEAGSMMLKCPVRASTRAHDATSGSSVR